MVGKKTASLKNSTLSSLQQDILEAFFRCETRFFLTGGAALAGYHLCHRTTNDLDLFALTDIVAQGQATLLSVAEELGATLEKITSAPNFARSLITREDEGVVVDLVYERVAQGSVEKLVFGRVRIDPPEEILANKLCTLLSRAEIRDLVDVMALEQAGYSIENALPLAAQKDAGLTPAQLAWVLSQIEIGPDAVIPGHANVEDVRAFLRDLLARLRKLAMPK